MYGLVFLGAVLTVVALYYYLLVARRMYIEAPMRREPVPMPGLLGVAIAVCVARCGRHGGLPWPVGHAGPARRLDAVPVDVVSG